MIFLIEKSVLETGIITTVIGIGTVFFILCLISFILYLFGKFMSGLLKDAPQRQMSQPVQPAKVAEEAVPEIEPEDVITDDNELIAVITAAIAAAMGENVTPDKLVVKSLKRVRSSSWKNQAVFEQQLNDF